MYAQEILREFKHEEEQADLPPVDTCFQQLEQLFNLVKEGKNADDMKRLQKLIAEKLLAPMSAYINTFLPHMLQDRISIARVLDNAAQNIDESKNPKSNYVQRSDRRQLNIGMALFQDFKIWLLEYISASGVIK